VVGRQTTTTTLLRRFSQTRKNKKTKLVVGKIWGNRQHDMLTFAFSFAFPFCLDKAAAGTVPITYLEADGSEKTVDAEIGQNLMQVAHDNDIELEGMCVFVCVYVCIFMCVP
jgi:hypothetical protein